MSDIDERVIKNRGPWNTEPALAVPPGERAWTAQLGDIDERVIKNRGLWNTAPALAEPAGGLPWAAKLSDIDERVIKNRGLWNTEPALAEPTSEFAEHSPRNDVKTASQNHPSTRAGGKDDGS